MTRAIPSTIRTIAVLATLTLGAASALANPELDAAKKAYDELEFEVAKQHLERAFQWGENTPEEMREILRFSGEMSAALGDVDAAEVFFFQMLTLAPSAELPAGSSPKLTEPFGQAKKRVAETGGLEARCELDGDSSTARVTIESDPARLVAGARAVYQIPDASEQRAEARGQDMGQGQGPWHIAIALPDTPGLALFCAVIDQHGNHLMEIGSRDSPMVMKPAVDVRSEVPDEPPPRPRGQSFFAHWLTWGSLGVVGAAAGGAFAWRMRSDQKALDALNAESGEHDFAEAQALARSGRDNALFANISFAVAGAFAVVSVVQFARRPKSERRTKGASITPMFTDEGAGIVVRGAF